MSFKNLDHDQQLALVALMTGVAMANEEISEGEIKCIEKVANELGDETYRSLIDEAAKHFANADDLKNFLKGIEDKSVQELIYGTVWEESMADPDIKHNESELLDWLKTIWNIQVSTE
jgi:hypothetical protein